MKKFHFDTLLVFLIILFAMSGSVFAQNCEIADVTGTVVDCENNEFFVSLEFEFANTSDSFVVSGNGTGYGTFNYGAVPILIGPLPTNATEYEFVVTDVDEPNCTDFVELGIVECDTTTACELFDLVVEFDECTSDSTYRIVLNFGHANTGGVGFDLWANGNLFGFYSYNDLPLTISNFPLGAGNGDGLQVCDNDNLNCCASEEWPTPNCASSGDCDIRDLVAEVYDCANGQFYAEIDFNYENTSDSFLLTINQQPVAAFMYSSLPLNIGPLPISSYNVLIADLLDPDCNEMIVMDTTGCANAVCALTELVVEFDECTSDSTYRVFVDFEHVNTGVPFFTLNANGNYFGTYEYSELPLTINNFPVGPGSANGLTVCDTFYMDCCASAEWPTPNCGTGGDCDIRDVEIEVVDCVNGQFFAVIDFIHENTSDSFSITGNGQDYGDYSYGQVPVTLGPFTSNSGYEFIITDNGMMNCTDFGEVSQNACDSNSVCILFDLEVEFDECTSDSTYRVIVDFEHVNTSIPYFILNANGNFFGLFEYAELPLTINNFPVGPGSTNGLTVCDSFFQDCCASEDWPTPNCGTGGDCDIRDVEIEVVDCVNGQFFAVIDFIHENTSDSFSITGNGQDYGDYSYGQVPVTLGPFTSNSGYEFIITDNGMMNCTDFGEVSQNACDSNSVCVLFDLEVEFDECTSDSTYRVIVDFEHVNTSIPYFILNANGNFFGLFEYAELPLTINNFPVGPGSTNGLTVCDSFFQDCCASEDWQTPNCGTGGDCDIRDVEIEVVDCENGQFFAVIDFIHENTSDSFSITGNGNDYGDFSYGQVPVTLGPFTSNSGYEFIITDNDMLNCTDFGGVSPQACDSNSICALFDLEVEVDECTSDSTYRIFVDFEHANTGVSFFTLTANGNYYGVYAYADLPLTIDHFPVGPGAVNFLSVCDTFYMDCCASTEWQTPSCGQGGQCSISDISVEEFDCDSFQYYLEVDFDHAHVGDSFTLQGNGQFYGRFSYLALPIVLGPFSVNSVINELVVIDATFMNCLDEIEFDIACGGVNECGIGDLEVEVGEINGSAFELTFNFEYDNVSDSFDAFSGNTYVGTFAYNNLPITIADFPTRNLPYELLRVCDAEYQNCCDVIEFMVEPGCEECKISELSATVVECLGDSIIVIMIDFDIEEGSADGFEVIGNGFNYGTFQYHALPIEITIDYEADDFVDLIIRDLSTPTCLGYTFVNDVDCEELCEITDLTVDFQECTSDTTYNFILDFEYQGTAGVGFDLFANGQSIGFFNYSALPLLIEDFVSTGVQIDQFVVCDNDNANCCDDVNLPIPICITGLLDPDYEKGLRINMLPGEWQIKVSEPGEMTIFDMAGRQIRPNFTIVNDYLISDLAAGAYLITWTGHWGIVSRKAVFYGK